MINKPFTPQAEVIDTIGTDGMILLLQSDEINIDEVIHVDASWTRLGPRGEARA